MWVYSKVRALSSDCVYVYIFLSALQKMVLLPKFGKLIANNFVN